MPKIDTNVLRELGAYLLNTHTNDACRKVISAADELDRLRADINLSDKIAQCDREDIRIRAERNRWLDAENKRLHEDLRKEGERVTYWMNAYNKDVAGRTNMTLRALALISKIANDETCDPFEMAKSFAKYREQCRAHLQGGLSDEKR
ncbi:hypothetical protein [Tumebacillus permanentifrigoris]|uniref:Uncharacterized protein n=1 Tax=Tumebacillus permanentifrigoris TaxID=378543 RepID=A0A316DAL7_9BACL|nr:hypothetical protein [Tumebacillus permanentifrigoris]PWK10202.1 hypothetical protein C7459_11223 [Tumebacillus permanentifrigoris]